MMTKKFFAQLFYIPQGDGARLIVEGGYFFGQQRNEI